MDSNSRALTSQAWGLQQLGRKRKLQKSHTMETKPTKERD